MSETPCIWIRYRNHRGEVAVRQVRVLGYAFKAVPPWHPEPTHVLDAFDTGKGEARSFAMCRIEAMGDVAAALATTPATVADEVMERVRGATLAVFGRVREIAAPNSTRRIRPSSTRSWNSSGR